VRHVVVGIALIGLCVGALACSPDDPSTTRVQPPHRFRLSQPVDADLRALTPREEAWRASLVRNLRHRGDVLTFARADVELFDQGTPRDGFVFANLANGDQFLVRTTQSVVVDFGARQIGTSGTDGISFHPHPAGRIVVALIPTRGVSVLGGVCLSNSKCGPGRFAFREREATWDDV
jgi:hypothetical protein